MDDLVQELRDWAEIVEAAATHNVHVQVLNMNMCKEAADEIERLRSQIERLQDAGQSLAIAYRTLGGLDVSYDAALRNWEDINYE
jgi:hypothetical protein